MSNKLGPKLNSSLTIVCLDLIILAHKSQMGEEHSPKSLLVKLLGINMVFLISSGTLIKIKT